MTSCPISAEALHIGSPNKFAAAAPLCGRRKDNRGLYKITHVPIWFFHGEDDTTVSYAEGLANYNIICENAGVTPSSKTYSKEDPPYTLQHAVNPNAGNDLKFTTYHNVGHGGPAYSREDLYEWMLYQQLPDTNQAPSLTFTPNLNSGSIELGSTETLTVTATDSDGTISSIRVEINGNLISREAYDGQQASETFNIENIFTALPPGPHTLRISTIDNAGREFAVTKSFNVMEVLGDRRPTAKINISTIQGDAPFTVNFDASASSDNGSVSYIWEFGDGKMGTGVKPSHTYTEDGVYNVLLTVTDEAGQADTAQATVGVGDVPVPGLWYGELSGNINTNGTNPRTRIVTDVTAEVESIGGNKTEVFTGYIYDADGQISFTEDIDSKARVYIDGSLVLTSDHWADRVSTANLELSPGWHAIEIRISDGNDGTSGSATDPGIGFDPAGGTNWIPLVDPGYGSLLVVGDPVYVPPVTYALTVSGDDGTAAGGYETDAQVSLTADIPEGQHFVKWTSSNGGTFTNETSATTTFTMPAADTTVAANFTHVPPAVQYTLTVSGDDGTTAGEYEADAQVSLTADIPEGQQFVKWTTSNGGTFASETSATTTFTMPAADTTVAAVFEAVPQDSVQTLRLDFGDDNQAQKIGIVGGGTWNTIANNGDDPDVDIAVGTNAVLKDTTRTDSGISIGSWVGTGKLLTPTANNQDAIAYDGTIFDGANGNAGIDALLSRVNRINNDVNLRYDVLTEINEAGYNLTFKKFILITGHRRENFGEGFLNICQALKELAERNPEIDFVYPVHLNPNVQEPVKSILGEHKNIYLTTPLQYDAFIYLMINCDFIISDSGGIQEEAPSLGKPVLVMRETTERPEAVEAGTVKLVGADCQGIIDAAQKLINDPLEYESMSEAHNPYGDGHACKRIIDALISNFKLHKLLND